MPIEANYYDELVYITSPTTAATVQEIYDACMEAGDNMEGSSFHFDIQPGHSIVDSVGKDDVGGGFQTGVVMYLASTWQIQYWNGVGYGLIYGGNIVGGVGGDPIKPTGGSDTVKLLGDVGGVQVATGGEFTDNQKTGILAVLGVETDGSIVLPAQGGLYEALQRLMKMLALSFKDTLRHTRAYGGAGPTGNDVTTEIFSAYDGADIGGAATEIYRFTIEYTYENNLPKEMKMIEVAVP